MTSGLKTQRAYSYFVAS